MKITLEDIRAKFDALVAQQQSAEQVAAFAMAAIQASDAKRLDLEKDLLTKFGRQFCIFRAWTFRSVLVVIFTARMTF